MSSHDPSVFTDESAEIALINEFVHPLARVLEGGCGKGRIDSSTQTIGSIASLLVAVDPLASDIYTSRSSNVLITAALGSREGSARFIENEEWWNSITLDATPQWGKPMKAYDVAMVSAPRLIQEYKIDTVVLDIEGAEWSLIPVIAKERRVKTLIAELHPFYAKTHVRYKALDAILKAGMKIVRIEGTSHNDNWHLVAVRE